MYRVSTPEALALKKALEDEGIIVEAEKWDGHKHNDLVIHRARMNIEVDGRQHYLDPFQILSDLARNHYSNQKGYDTVHIPNDYVRSDLHKIARALATAAYIRSNRLGHRFHYKHSRLVTP
jgi:very-short-patch-repair endonuclease